MISNVKNILVICLAGVGDVLMSTPLLRELSQHFEEAEIDVLVMQGEPAAAILEGNVHVRERMLFDFRKEPFSRSFRFCLGLRRRRYDLSFTVMPQNRLEYNIISALIGARSRIGFRFTISCGAMPSLFFSRAVPEDPDIHLIDNNMRLLTEGLGIAATSDAPVMDLHMPGSSRAKAEAFIADFDLRGKTLVGLHAGTGSTKNLSIRRWPADCWAQLGGLIGEDDQARVIVMGSQEEGPLVQSIIEGSGLPPDRILASPPGTLQDAAALIARFDCLVCCDTLLTHMAAAVGVPEVVIMGPTPHTSVYPYGVPHRIVRTGIACSPCYGYSRHGIRCTHDVKMKCLKDITPEMVKQALDERRAEVSDPVRSTGLRRDANGYPP